MTRAPFQPTNRHVLGCLGFIAALGLGMVVVAIMYAVAHVLTGAGRQGRGYDDAD